MNKHLLFSLSLIILAACSGQDATIKEEMRSFPTYSFSDPNPVAQPEAYFYPYFKFDGYAETAEEKDWKVVELENKYVKVLVFPEIGGKVWGAIEKSTNNEFLYTNSVVKFRNIAMRGPWTSGGIEFNFGIIGHSPTTSTPVDYRIRKNKDGSVSCFVGSLDLLTRIRWETEINLQPDKAYFTTTTSYINTNPIVQPYYQWSNAAFSARGNPEMIFPGNHTIGHEGEAASWPRDENGLLLSVYENNKFGDDKSYHIIGKPEGFFASYWHDLNFGAGHYANYGDKLGKKIYLWSQARSGGIWEDLLTDTDGQYIELQSGRLMNQASGSSMRTPFKHFGFQPYTTDTFKEFWYPILNTEGVIKANQFGTLNIKKEGNSQTIYFSPLQHIKGEVQIYFGENLKFAFNINIDPLELWSETIELNPTNEPLKIIIGEGKSFVYSESDDNINSNRPVVSPEDFDWNSLFGLYTHGLSLINQGSFDAAFYPIKRCLELDPYYAPALNTIAELYVRKAEFDKALDAVKKSLAVNTYDPKANFIFALASRNTNNKIDAHDGFAVSSISPEYRVASYVELAKLFISMTQYSKAQEYALKILAQDTNNQEGLLLMSIISRKSGDKKSALKYIEKLENISPLNHFSRFERYLLNNNSNTTKDFTGSITTELAYQTFLEMSLFYEYIDCKEEAIALLELSPESVMSDFKLADLYNATNNNEKSMFYLERGIEKPIDFVLPFRPEFKQMLEWVDSMSDNWKANYYLGLLNWSMGNKTIARELFTSCSDKPDSPYFYLAKVNLFLGDIQYDEIDDLQRANSLAPNEWRISLKLIEYYLHSNRRQEALALSKEALETFPENSQIKFTHAKSLLANELFQDCFDILEKTTILPHEGSQSGRILYRQAAVMQSLHFYRNNQYADAISIIQKARIWPENLGVGKPDKPDQRIEDFLEAEYLLKSGNKEKAEELYDNIITFTQNRYSFNSTDLLYLIILKRLSKSKEIDDFLTRWDNQSTEKDVLTWVKQVLYSNRNIENSKMVGSRNVEEGTPWNPVYSDFSFELIKEIARNVEI